MTKTPYVVVLPGRNERDFSDFSKLEVTFANKPYNATKNILFRKLRKNMHQRQRQAIVLRLADDMDSSGQNLEKYAYEIETEFQDEKGRKIPMRDKSYRLAQECFLAEEIASKKGFPKRGKDYLGTAKEMLDFYYEELLRYNHKH